MCAFIDPEEFPFTADEVFQAACRYLPADTARQVADHLAACGPDIVATRSERRAVWRTAGLTDADTAPLHAWVYPEELLPALASLSEDVALRARQIVEADWGALEHSLVSTAQRRAAEAANIIPTPQQLLEELQRQGQETGSPTGSLDGLAVSLPPLPPPTADMYAAAAALIAEKREQWEALVRRYRTKPGVG